MGVPISIEDIDFHLNDLKVNINDHLKYHVKKKLDFNRVDLESLDDQEKYKLSYKLSNHLNSKGYKDFNIQTILKEVS